MSLLTASVAYGIGALPFGNADPDASCRNGPVPAGTVDWQEPSTGVEGSSTTIPLGVLCHFDAHDGSPEQVVPHQSWAATIVWLAASTVSVLAAVVFLTMLLQALLVGRRTASSRAVAG